MDSNFFSQLGHDLEQVANEANVGDLEDRRILVLVDGDDGLTGTRTFICFSKIVSACVPISAQPPELWVYQSSFHRLE